MAQLDDAVTNLERFNQTLAGLTPRLQEAAGELAGHVTTLQTTHGELRTKLTEAQSAVSDLDTELSTFSHTLETEADTVGSVALDEVDHALTELDASVRELAAAAPAEIANRAQGVQDDLETIQNDGFIVLGKVLAHVGSGFASWAHPAEETLHELDAELHAASDELAHARELIDEPESWIVHHTDPGAWGHLQNATVEVEDHIPAGFAHDAVATDLATVQQSLAQDIHTDTHDLREQLDTLMHEVAEDISRHETALIDGTEALVGNLELAENGAEKAEQEATTTMQHASALLDTTQKIEAADLELQIIRNVMEAMSTP